jgi:hypothetical protein
MLSLELYYRWERSGGNKNFQLPKGPKMFEFLKLKAMHHNVIVIQVLDWVYVTFLASAFILFS